MNRYRIRLLLLLFILPAIALIFYSEGCGKKETRAPAPFKTEPVEERRVTEHERRIQALEDNCADITSELVNALSSRKLSVEERRLKMILASSPADTRSRIALGNLYLSKREYQMAENEFRLAADRSTDRPSEKIKALSLLAMTSYIRGDWRRGEKLFNEAITLFPTSPEPHVVRGDTWVYLWNLEDALKEYEKALSFKSNDSYLMVACGDLLVLQGKYGMAEKHYRDALTRSPKEPIILEKLGSLDMMCGKRSEAQKLYADSAALSPHDPLIVMKMILAAEEDSALLLGEKAVEESSEVYREYFGVLKGLMLLRRESYMEAEQSLRGPFKEESLIRLSRYPYTLSLFRQKKEKEAYTILDQLISQDRFDSKALAMRAWLNLRENRLPNALVDSAQSVDIKPYASSQQLLQAFVLSQVEKMKLFDQIELIKNYEKQLATSPEKEVIHYALGILLLKAREYIESLKQFRMAAESSDSFYMRKVASILANGGNDREALAALGKALEKNRDDIVAQREEGALYLKMKKGKEALALFSALSQKERDNAFILYFEALAFKSTGREKEALSAFARACEMDSELPAIFFEMAESYEKLGNKKSALLLYRYFDRQERIKAVQDREKLEEARKRSEYINKASRGKSGEGTGSSK